MAAVSLNSNLSALRGERSLNASGAELSSTLERLASGKRINHASDDAAGLAVSSTLNATARIHTQAARNVNEAISFLNVADGATSALKDILFRMRELSTQSSNGTFSNAQRLAIDKESQALQEEYGRILDSTSYNGIRVFASGDMVAQAGFGAQAALVVNFSSGGSTTTATGNGTFQAYRPFSVGPGWDPIDAADFDGDGKVDLASANSDDNTLSVLLSNGNGTFKAERTFTTSSPGALAVGDFDGDGKRDLVTSGSVLLGNGNGTFKAERAVAEGGNVYWVAVADFNGDSKSDLAAADNALNSANVLLGNGNGTFKARVVYDSPYSPVDLALADLNGDSNSDIVTANPFYDCGYVLIGNGNGTFQDKETYYSGDAPAFVVADDFNGDGKGDLAIADQNDDAASVLLGNGNGTFQLKQSYTAGRADAAIAASDLNGDSKSDLVTMDTTDHTMSVLLGNGNGTFKARATYDVGSVGSTIVAADFNSDGVKDLATAYGGMVSVLLGNASTTTTTLPGLRPITGVSLATQQDALAAQGQIDGYLDTVNKVSATIGTALSRFQIAAHVASSVADVSQAAEARITEADTAENSAVLLRSKILQQASAAVLAQANQQPALALRLLRE